MEIDEDGPATHEARMEDYARRTARAAEALTMYAFWWSLLAALGVLVLIFVVRR